MFGLRKRVEELERDNKMLMEFCQTAYLVLNDFNNTIKDVSSVVLSLEERLSEKEWEDVCSRQEAE